MKLIEKGKDEPVHLGWDAAQTALAKGTHELAPPDGERVEDQPTTQSPKPGVDPYDAKLVDNTGSLPNLRPTTVAAGTTAAPTPGATPPEPAKVSETKPADVKPAPAK